MKERKDETILKTKEENSSKIYIIETKYCAACGKEIPEGTGHICLECKLKYNV